jgi:hypothetical protein
MKFNYIDGRWHATYKDLEGNVYSAVNRSFFKAFVFCGELVFKEAV